MLSQLKNQLKALSESNDIAEEVFKHAQVLFINGQCQLLSQSKEQFDFWVSDEFNDTEVSILIEALGDNEEEETQYHFSTTKKGKVVDWDKNSVACLMQLSEELSRFETDQQPSSGKQYTREGMIKRVLEERKEKAKSAEYRIEFADNIYGEHLLTNERGVKYRITLRDFENETGYVNNMDLQTNKERVKYS